MAIKNSVPMRFTPKGLADAFDSTDAFPGAAQSLSNLIFDNSNPELVVARPGAQQLFNLSGAIVNPGFISLQVSVGTRVYGMVASTRFAGHDEPFCYDFAKGSTVPISGVTSANTPLSPATAGDWEPPTIASVGVYLLITHPGLSGTGANFFGVIDLTVPTSPAWSTSNTATNVLTARPSAVANLNNRAYFAVGNQLEFTDVLAPLTRTNASQALTLGDTGIITALAGLSVQTTSSGVLAALTAFKANQCWQVIGDSASSTNPLAQNYLSLTIGTSAPRTIAQSPSGLYFVSTGGGPYFIDPLGTLRLLTYRSESVVPDVQAPFINATTPSRWAAAYNASIYRVCGPTVVRGVQVTNDYWFDERRRRWNGPHSFAYDCASALAGFFVLTGAGNPGLIIQSSPTRLLTSVYNDLGAPCTVTMLSATLPKSQEMSTKQVVETQAEMGGYPSGVSYLVSAQDEQGVQLNQVTVNVPATNVPLWGAVTWGSFLWTTAQSIAPRTYPIPWTAPLVFEKMQIQVTAASSAAVQIGTLYARYQPTGYMVRAQ